jgi:hypothetical protein
MTDIIAARSTEVVYLAEIGLSVIPIGAGRDGKAPRTKWTQWQEQRPGKEQIQRWLRMSPPAWAVIGGRVSDRFILDFDTAGNGSCLLLEWGLEPHVRTPSGGYHVHVSLPTLPVRSQGWRNGDGPTSWGNRFPGLDVQSDGKYAVTLGRNRVGRYQLLRDLGQVVRWEDLPKELRQALTERTVAPRREVAAKGLGRGATSDARRRAGRVTRSDIRAPQTLVREELDGRDLGDQLVLGALPGDPSAARNHAGFRDFAKRCRDAGLSLKEAQDLAPQFVDLANAGYRDGYRDEPYALEECEASWRSAYRLVLRIERMRMARLAFKWRGKGAGLHEALLQRALKVGSTEFDMRTRELAHAAGMSNGRAVTKWTRRFCTNNLLEVVEQSGSGRDRVATRWRLLDPGDELHKDHPPQHNNNNTACVDYVQHSLALYGFDAFRHGALAHCHDTLAILASLTHPASRSGLATLSRKTPGTISRHLKLLEKHDLVSRSKGKWKANTDNLHNKLEAAAERLGTSGKSDRDARRYVRERHEYDEWQAQQKSRRHDAEAKAGDGHIGADTPTGVLKESRSKAQRGLSEQEREVRGVVRSGGYIARADASPSFRLGRRRSREDPLDLLEAAREIRVSSHEQVERSGQLDHAEDEDARFRISLRSVDAERRIRMARSGCRERSTATPVPPPPSLESADTCATPYTGTGRRASCRSV